MRFRNEESTEWVIYKWMDREWHHWDGPFTAKAGYAALEVQREGLLLGPADVFFSEERGRVRVWMKWSHKWATGERDYEWVELRCTAEQAPEVAQETARELGSIYDYADTYRGVAFELFEVPPVEVIQAHLLQAEQSLLGYQRRVQELQELLVQMIK